MTKKMTFVLLAVLGLMAVAPVTASAFSPAHQFAPSESGG
jgi:hypothetical protein